ncbi:unnamed protein product [Parajaminaea phylloscopi]
MVQSILHPRQASQLLRCWGRDTLVPQRFFQHKSPSIKDLEIVWNAVNQSLHENPSEQVAEGERRVRADYRDYQDYQEPDEGCIGAEDWHREGGSGAPSASERTFKAVRRAVTRPQRRRDRSWTPGAGYAAHNTLLLDDSPSKAALQPFNHLLIPEFEREAAYVTKRERAAARAAAKGGTQHIVSEDIDTVLLQTVGVIEHARYQRNVAAWIHSHGLGGFAGMQQAMGSAAGSAELIQREDVKEVGSGHEVINAEFEGHVADANTEALKPRLEMPSDQRTQAFWQSTSVDRSGETTPSPKQQPADTPPEPRIAGPSTTAGQAEIAPGKNASSIAEQDAAMFRALHDRDGGGLGNETVDGEFEAGMKKFTRANQFRVI